MALYPIRCRNNACRHRRQSRVHPFDYKVVPACDVCGQRKGWRIEHQAKDPRELCDCGGVMGRVRSVRHKKSHPLCIHHPDGKKNQLRRAGYTEEQIFDAIPLDELGRKMGKDEPCPF